MQSDKATDGGATPNTSRTYLSTFAEVNRSYPYVVLSNAIFFLWIGLVFQSPLFSGGLGIRTGGGLTWLATTAVYSAGYLLVACAYRRVAKFFGGRKPIIVSSIAMVIGVLLINCEVIWPTTDFGAFATPFEMTGCLLVALGTCFLMLTSASAQAFIGPRKSIILSGTSMIIATAFMALISLLDHSLLWILESLLPLLMAYSCVCIFKTVSRKQVFSRGLDSHPALPVRLLVTSCLHGMALGVLLVLLCTSSGAVSPLLFDAAFFFLGAVLVILLIFGTHSDFDHLIYVIGFPVMSLGLLLVLLLSRNVFIGCALIACGYSLLHITMCGVCAYLASRFELPTLWVLSWTTTCFVIGQILGVSLIPVLVVHGAALGTICAALVFLFLFVSVLCTASRSVMRYGWGVVRPSVEKAASSPLEFAVQRIAVEAGLTSREKEIALNLAQGASRKQIAEAFVLSEETVKTHSSHIYSKLGIHSKEEFLKIVEKQTEADKG